MVLRDPALVIALLRTARDSRAIRAYDADLRCWVYWLSAQRHTGALPAFAAAPLLLREERRDPRIIHEVCGTCEAARQDQVEEDAAGDCVSIARFGRVVRYKLAKREDLHLGIEHTLRLFYYAHCSLKRAYAKESIALVQHGAQLQQQILRVHFHLDAIAERLTLARGHHAAIPDGREVLHNLRWVVWVGAVRGPKGAAHELERHGVGFGIVDGKDGAVADAVHELDAKDFRGGESGVDANGEIGRGRWVTSFSFQGLDVRLICVCQWRVVRVGRLEDPLRDHWDRGSEAVVGAWVGGHTSVAP